MKLNLLLVIIITILFTGCFKGEGQIRITSDQENAIIYVDGDKKGMTGDGYTTIILDEGDHKILIYKEKDKESFYEGSQDIFVGANSSVKIKIDTERKATKFGLSKLLKEKQERKAKLIKEREAKYGNMKDIWYDKNTALVWQDNNVINTLDLTRIKGQKYCKDLILHHLTDWRLPEKQELLNLSKSVHLLNYSPKGAIWWSNTEAIDYIEGFYWSVNLDDATSDRESKYEISSVRCVR